VFPVTVHKHGVLSRPEISDAAADLARLSGFPPVATYCKILDDDGAIMSPQAVPEFAKKHKIPWIDVDDIVAFRNRHEVLVTCEVLNHHDTPFGPCTFRVYRSDVDNLRHIVITMGDINDALPLVRVHSQCLTGDAFGSLRCDCGAQLDSAMSKIAEEGRGVMIYLLQEGRGIGFLNKVRAYALQDEGQDTVEANLSLGLGVDLRNYGVAAHILNDLGVTNCRLLTNNPKKLEALTAAGIDIAERLPLEIDPDPHTRPYLTTKKYKLGHILEKV
jgi:3,4-dihydroxy 2-butanone 4-phosphate synthase/GTP cyclohydrolase II